MEYRRMSFSQTHPKIVEAKDYYTLLVDYITQARDQIYICSMTFTLGDKINHIIDLLLLSLKRQVKICLVIDIYSFSVIGEERQNVIKQKRLINKRLSALRTAGADIRVVGKIGLNPFAHRTHVKAVVIDDLVLCFGGINFSETSFNNNDYMLGINNKQLADKVISIINSTSNLNCPNINYRFNETNQLLYDGGNQHQSIIYDKACQLTARAHQVLFVSRMCPSGQLAKLMAQSNTKYIYNRANQTKFPTNLSITYDQLIYKIKNSYQGEKYVHAKLILFTMLNGEKYLISGSNNFNYRGIKYGTKEIALLSSDTKLWQQLLELISKL